MTQARHGQLDVELGTIMEERAWGLNVIYSETFIGRQI